MSRSHMSRYADSALDDDGPAVTLVWVSGSTSKEVGGCARIATMMAQMGLGCTSGKPAFVDAGKLALTAFSGITSGLNGWIPVVRNVASTDSFVNARRNAQPKTPVKSPFFTFALCKFSKV